MLKKILGTIGTRYLVALLNLALIFINAKVLGVEGVGMIGLIVASVNIAVIFNGILSGNTIVYFLNRYSIQTLFAPVYLWTLPGTTIACLFMYFTGLLPQAYWIDIFLLSILSSLVVANARFLLGKNKIKGFNVTFIIQGGLLFFTLLYFYYIVQRQDVQVYIWGLYVTNGTAFLVSLLLLLPVLKQKDATSKPVKSIGTLLKEMFMYGLWAGADNLAEVLTTRLNYFLIQRFGGLGSVGLLDGGTKISESVWHISRSVSFIAYGSIAATNEEVRQKQIALQLFKLTFWMLLIVMAGIVCIPERIYTQYLFSPEFEGIRQVIIGLSFGIVALGSNSILSHYFIGSGKIRYSTLCSCIGLLTLLIVGSLLIPKYGVTGSAISTSIAFTAMLLFSLIVFMQQTHTRFREFFPGREDWSYLCRKLRRA